VLPALLAACSASVLDRPAADVPVRPVPHETTGTSLALAPGSFLLRPSHRPGGEPAPASFSPIGTFERAEERNRVDVWRIPLPVHDNLLPTRTEGTHTFGSDPPPGFVVTGPHGALHFERSGRAPGSYGFDRHYLYVGVAPGSPAPVPSDYTVSFPRATAAENALNQATSGLSASAFVQRDLTFGRDSRRALYLPAPAEASFKLLVPERGTLAFDAMLVPPAIRAERESDGALVRVVVNDGREDHDVGTLELKTGKQAPGRFDLGAWAGRTVELMIETETGDDPLYDYVLLEAPVVYTPSDSPRRIVMLFVDTLRPDHLGVYGYARPTSPSIDRWAKYATVFEQARSVAPWTLPAARAVLSGTQPERYFETERLQDVLSAAGWRTEAHVTNAFLSQPFETHLGWDHFRYDHFMDADGVLAAARDTLHRHSDRDLLLLLHFMEPHLPYDEPRKFRGMFAGPQPDEVDEVSRAELVKVKPGDPGFDEIRAYVTARYDQNVRAIDEALGDFLEELGPDATVVLFSDHGEELWDHGGFEHGHAFYDELLRVPLVIKSPALPPGRIAAPVSLLDIAPTLREIAGLPLDAQAPGISLVGLAWGDAGEAERFAARPQAFGRPLYGPDGWGVVADHHKWWDRDGSQVVFDLAADPAEMRPLRNDLDRWPAQLEAALGREVKTVWRVTPELGTWVSDMELVLSHPSGIAAVWPAYEPRGPEAAAPELRGGVVHLVVSPHAETPDAFYVVPSGDPYDVAGLAVSILGRGINIAGAAKDEPVPRDDATSPIVLRVKEGRFGATVDIAHVPEPAGHDVRGFHPDVAEELRELGYVE